MVKIEVLCIHVLDVVVSLSFGSAIEHTHLQHHVKVDTCSWSPDMPASRCMWRPETLCLALQGRRIS